MVVGVSTGPGWRLAQAVARFRDMPTHALVAAIATDDGVARLTYGDLAALAQALSTAEERLSRIADWHSQKRGPAGTVDGFCTECETRWPCDTRRLADGTYEERRPYEPG